mmetsp:Transcript_16540/g.28113  ORF Transcript_16540/g.28113 Transcript_16540/m.28113 type:complete len:181 (+) Transcript_16540:589-1131(+)
MQLYRSSITNLSIDAAQTPNPSTQADSSSESTGDGPLANPLPVKGLEPTSPFQANLNWVVNRLVLPNQRFHFGLLVLLQVLGHFIGGKVVKERLLVIKDLGIQFSTQSLSGKQGVHKFYDISRIRDFIINDYVTFYYVRQYCGFLVENEKKIIVPFKNSDRLRQLDLEYIYCSVKQMLAQ